MRFPARRPASSTVAYDSAVPESENRNAIPLPDMSSGTRIFSAATAAPASGDKKAAAATTAMLDSPSRTPGRGSGSGRS